MENIRGVPVVRVVVKRPDANLRSGVPGFCRMSALMDERENWEFVAECDKLDKFGRKEAPERPPHATCGLLCGVVLDCPASRDTGNTICCPVIH